MEKALMTATPEHAEISKDGLLNAEQAASYLNISESFIRKAVAGRRIPFVSIGTRKLFRRSDLDEWVGARVVRTDEEIYSQAQTIAATAKLRRPVNRGISR